MFNLYVDLADHDMVTDAVRATMCRLKIKAPSLQTQVTKDEGHPEDMGFDGKTILGFQKKSRTQIIFATSQKTPVGHQNLKVIIGISAL